MTIVLAAAQNTGRANALVPVLKKLNGDRVQAAVLTLGEAAKVFSAATIEHQTLYEPTNYGPDFIETIHHRMSHIAPDVLLLGTAWRPSLDKVLIPAAQSDNVP